MLERYLIDLSALSSNDEILKIKEQIETVAFEVFDGEQPKTFDVYVNTGRGNFRLPPECTVTRIG